MPTKNSKISLLNLIILSLPFSQKTSEKNLKITTLDDLEIFKALLKAKKEHWIKE